MTCDGTARSGQDVTARALDRHEVARDVAARFGGHTTVCHGALVCARGVAPSPGGPGDPRGRAAHGRGLATVGVSGAVR